MTARPTPNGEPTTDPWQWLHDNEFSWDDVNAVAAIFELGGWDVVKSEARATAPAGLRAEVCRALIRYLETEHGPSTYRTLIDYLDLDYATGMHEGWLDLNNLLVRLEEGSLAASEPDA